MADTPGKTGTPLIEDVDEDSVTMSWTKPRDDGGDKVQSYVVEVREKGTNKWKPLNEKSPCRDTKFTGKIYRRCRNICSWCFFLLLLFSLRAKLSGAVYCYRSCLWACVCVFVGFLVVEDS